MTNEMLEQKLGENPKVLHVAVGGDGKHYQLTIVSDEFVGKSKVKRQQWVYQMIKEYITAGDVHALSMTTWTKDEWEQRNG